MQMRRASDQTWYGMVNQFLLRSRTELIVITVCVLLVSSMVYMGLMNRQAVVGLLSLLISKAAVVIGILVAHLIRMGLFPYMDLSDAMRDKNYAIIAFLAGWYYVVIYCFSMGG
jgi:hypothetical protein